MSAPDGNLDEIGWIASPFVPGANVVSAMKYGIPEFSGAFKAGSMNG